MRPHRVFGQGPKRDLQYISEVRGVIGDHISLVVDIPGTRGLWDAPTAIKRFNEWEPFNLRWVEQPLSPADLAAHARLRAAVTTPIGTGEDEWSPETYRRLIESNGVDVVQLDPGRCLGLTGCREVVKMVQAAGLQYRVHSWSSALNPSACLSFLAMSEHGNTLDFKLHESPMQHELVDDLWVQQDHLLILRNRPALGVTVRQQAVDKYSFACS
jgi:L-alanine-DL-glutamate epimerase-like enolase superfamily enzyme